MDVAAERPLDRHALNDDFDKELEAFIMSEDSSQKDLDLTSPAKYKAPMTDKNGNKDMDKDLNDLLEGIEKGQLEMNSVEKEELGESDSSKKGVSPENLTGGGSEGSKEKYESDDMDVFVLPENNLSKPPHPVGDGDVSSDNDDDQDYELTEDQKRASLELEQLIAETEYFPDEEPPEYDVKDRIKQLNAELANEPMPDEREHKVMFKEDPVDLVVPPAEYEESQQQQQKQSDSTVPTEEKPAQTSDQTNDKTNDRGNDCPDGSAKGDSKHKVLIERDGKFELVSADDIRARDLGIQFSEEPSPQTQQPEESTTLPSSSVSTDEPDKESSVVVSPRPPPGPRPASSIPSGHRNVRSASSQRPHSAAVVEHGSALKNFSYVSPYGLTPQEKEQLKECIRRRQSRDKNYKAKKKEEELIKKKENNEAFDAWLKQKQNIAYQTRTMKSQDMKSEEANQTSYFKEWLQVKREQSRREKLLKQREEEERRCGQLVRSQKDCDQAFKQWIRKKNYEAWHRRGLERQKFGMLSSARRSHKSLTPLQLANFYRLTAYHSY